MKSRSIGQCMVCNDVAVGVNFGVLTCMPCKAFFRRNAVKLGTIDFVCQEDGDCPVTFESRRICNCCRLAKCFRVGMKKSLILSDAQRQARKELVQQNRKKRAHLSMVQNYGLTKPVDVRYTELKTRNFLLPSDQTLLANILGIYEQVYDASSNFQYLPFPAIEHTTIHTFFNEYEERHKVLIEFFKYIPEFNRLFIDDKIRILRNHFGVMININELMIAKCIHPNLMRSLKNVFGTSLAKDILHISERITAYAYDPVLLKLVLVIRSLSSSINRYREDTDMDRIFKDPLAIFIGQCAYVEILWRYLLSRLPSEKDTVKFFNKIILDLLFLQRSCFAVERLMYSLPQEVDKMSPLMQSMWPVSEKLTIMDCENCTDVRPTA